MSGYEIPYPPASIGYNLPLPVPIEPDWRPAPPPSTEQALQQPFDQWSRPNLGMPVPPAYPTAPSYDANGMVVPGGASMPQQHQQQGFSMPQPQSGWGLPRGGVIHVAPGIPDEMLPRQFAPGAELVKVTGKSCSSCRTRKVKCDRRYPECTRCIKRRDVCEYGDDVSFALRPIVGLNRPRGNDSPDSSDSSPRNGLHATENGFHGHTRLASSSLALPYPPRISSESESAPPRSLRTVSDFRHQLARRGGDQHSNQNTGEEAEASRQPGFQQLWDRFLNQSNLGESSSDWRLALPAMASSLTLHLLEASMNSCCYHLPAFHVFNPSIQYYKQNLDTLDVASQAAVGILASLGARASPHSALLGVAGPDIENGNASHDLVLSAGVRRESAWRAIVKQATELCSKLEVLQVPSVLNAQTLVAFVQMLMFSEVKPKTARFFLRAALGLFYDMQGGELPPHEVDHIKRSVGSPLYESDARIAAWLSLPALISEDDLDDYFEGTGVHLVDLETEDLGSQLTALFDPARGPMSLEKGEEALKITNFYVCAVQRLFAKISSNRRATPTRFLASIESLWGYIDGAHAACQLLTGALREFAMAQNDSHHSAHHDLLIGLRMHERLLDIMNLSNEWLRSKRKDNLSPQDRNALESFLGVSNRRVRRCLKVLAFYAKVFHDSHDKHVVYHLFTQLEAVENWATMAAQGEDEVDEFGPLGSQCVLTETELNYFSQALELACFYTPLSAQRLEEFTRARQVRNQRRSKFAQIPGYDISAPDSLVDNARAALSQSYSTDDRFTEIDDQTTVPPSINSTLDPNSNPLFAANPGASGAEVLTNWVLSGYAGNSSGTTVEGDSPSASSLSISPGYIVEQSSSPDTNASLPGNLVPPSSATGFVDRRASFVSSIENPHSFSALDSHGADVSFPSSTLTNLAQSYGSNNQHSLNGYTNGHGMLHSENSASDSTTLRNPSNEQNGGGERSADRMGWSTFSNWKSHSGVNGDSTGMNANSLSS
ncbi:hypothetical protein JCM3765_004874 [Sporobolomyces pararoseus]